MTGESFLDLFLTVHAMADRQHELKIAFVVEASAEYREEQRFSGIEFLDAPASDSEDKFPDLIPEERDDVLTKEREMLEE